MLGLFFVARLCSPSTRSRIVLVFGSFTVFRESATVYSVRSMPVCSDVLADSFPMRQIVSLWRSLKLVLPAVVVTAVCWTEARDQAG